MASILDLVKHYQHNIEKYPNDENRVLKCIEKLFNLDVKVQHLQETGVGRTVNALRKEPGDVGQAARALVYKWKAMVAQEASDEEENAQNSTNQNGHGDEDGTTPDPDYKHLNGNSSGSKRKYHSSEEEEPDTKKSKNHNSNGHDDSKRQVKVKKEESDSDTDSDESESESESESEEDVKPDRKIKIEPPDTYEPNTATQNISYDHVQVKKELSSPKKEENDKQISNSRGSSRNGHEKASLKERSHSSHKETCSKDKETSSDKKHKSEHKSSEKDRSKEGGHSSKHSSLDKHKSSSHRSESSSKHKIHLEKSASKSDKASSSRSHREESKKHKSSSEREDRHKSKDGSSSKDRSSSSKDKMRSTSKENSSSHKSDKKHSSEKSKSDSESKVDKKEEKTSEKKSLKSSSSSSHRSKSSSSSRSKEAKPKKVSFNNDNSDDDGIGCESGASFADALGMVSHSKNKKKTTPVKDAFSPNNSANNLSPAALLAPTTKLAPLPSIEISALPEISPNYRPRPPPKFLPHFTDEDAMSCVISSKNQRTKVYSGNKVLGNVPTLYEICVNILQEHIDALEYTGGVPYDILKPVVDRATPQQLFMLEHYNPYLMEDTDHLWQKFCEKNFRNKKRQELETFREMYMRCQEEQEHKLKSLTANIRMTQEAKKAPIKQTKMAYVDTVVKPPRNIARKQAMHGTAHMASASPAARVATLAAQPNVLKGGVRPAPAVSTSSFNKPKKAPLMQKALQLMRGRKR